MSTEQALIGSEAPETPASGEVEQRETPETEAVETKEALQEDENLEATEGDDEQEEDGEKDQANNPDDEDEVDADDGDDDADVFEEFEWQGKTYKVHPDLRPNLMMNADYTRKTQAVAERERTLEERDQAFEQQVQAHQNARDEIVKLQAIDLQLAQLEQTDWDALEVEDPLKIPRLSQQIQELRNARQQQSELIRTKGREWTENMQRESAKRDQEFQAALVREIKGWSPAMNLQLSEYARENGFTDQELASVRDVRQIKFLQKAHMWDQHLQKQKAVAKAKPKSKVKPLKEPAKGRAPARTGLSDDQDMNSWLATRRKQVEGRTRY